MVNFVQFINSYQIAVAIWFFVRDMKFLKIFYVLFNSFFHNGLFESLPEERDHITLISPLSLLHKSKGMEEDEEFGGNVKKMARGNVFYNFYPPVYKPESKTFLSKIVEPFMSPKEEIKVLLNPVSKSEIHFWQKEGVNSRVIKTKHYLLRDTFLCQVATDQDIIEHILNEGTFAVSRFRSIVDQSGDDDLNRNFTKFIQIIPPFLQANGLKEYSAAFFIFYYILDFFNKGVNKVWKSFKFSLIKFIKKIVNNFSLPYRKEIIGILSSSSEKFLYCDRAVFKSYDRRLGSILMMGNLAYADADFDPEDMNNSLGPYDEGFWKFLPNVGDKIEVRNFNINGFAHHLQIIFEGDKYDYDDKYFFPDFKVVLTSDYGESWSGQNIYKTKVHLIIHFLSKLQEHGQFPCFSIKRGYMHVKTPVECISKNSYRYFTLLRLKKEDIFHVSQYEIGFAMDIVYMLNFFKKVYSLDFLKKAIYHNHTYWGENLIDPMFRCLETRNGHRYFKSLPNKKWKKYVSDLDLLLLKYEGSSLRALDRFNPTKHYWKALDSDCVFCPEMMEILEEVDMDLLEPAKKNNKCKKIRVGNNNNKEMIKLDRFFKFLKDPHFKKPQKEKEKEKERGKMEKEIGEEKEEKESEIKAKQSGFINKLSSIYSVMRDKTILSLSGDEGLNPASKVGAKKELNVMGMKAEKVKNKQKNNKEIPIPKLNLKPMIKQLYRESLDYREELMLKKLTEKCPRPKECSFVKAKSFFCDFPNKLQEVKRESSIKKSSLNSEKESFKSNLDKLEKVSLCLSNFYDVLSDETQGKKIKNEVQLKNVEKKIKDLSMYSPNDFLDIKNCLSPNPKFKSLKIIESYKIGKVVPIQKENELLIRNGPSSLDFSIKMEIETTNKIEKVYDKIKEAKWKRGYFFKKEIFEILDKGGREIDLNSVMLSVYSFNCLRWVFKDVGLETFLHKKSRGVYFKGDKKKKMKNYLNSIIYNYIKNRNFPPDNDIFKGHIKLNLNYSKVFCCPSVTEVFEISKEELNGFRVKINEKNSRKNDDNLFLKKLDKILRCRMFSPIKGSSSRVLNDISEMRNDQRECCKISDDTDDVVSLYKGKFLEVESIREKVRSKIQEMCSKGKGKEKEKEKEKEEKKNNYELGDSIEDSESFFKIFN